jgi:serine phosphatase RsbU (regulator of sigma subunit)
MTTATETVRAFTWRSVDLLRGLFNGSAPSIPSDPLHCDVPALQNAEIACVYYAERIAGDFYEFLRASPSRMLFALLDVAGRRVDTRDVLIAAQKTFRKRAPKLFGADDINESEAMIELCHEINRTILQFAGGVRSCPGFLGCYNSALGTVCYVNAGHTPGLVRDGGGITVLEATGLPLGLFSHTIHGAPTCVLVPGAALLLISRGMIEAESNAEDFGLERAKETLQRAALHTAGDLCLTVLGAARDFVGALPFHNDVTALALIRHST